MTDRPIAVEQPAEDNGQGGAIGWIPWNNGEIRPVDQPGDLLAISHRANVLSSAWSPPTGAESATLIVDSGSLADGGLAEPHPMNWMRPGRKALDAWLHRVAPAFESAGGRLLLQPHALHVLSDAPSTAAFLDDHADWREKGVLGLALDPSSLITPSMLNDVEDHLTRIFERVGPSVDLLLLADLVAPEAAETPANTCPGLPLGQGVLPREHVLGLIDACVPPDALIVILPHHFDRQLAWLDAPSPDRA